MKKVVALNSKIEAYSNVDHLNYLDMVPKHILRLKPDQMYMEMQGEGKLERAYTPDEIRTFLTMLNKFRLEMGRDCIQFKVMSISHLDRINNHIYKNLSTQLERLQEGELFSVLAVDLRENRITGHVGAIHIQRLQDHFAFVITDSCLQDFILTRMAIKISQSLQEKVQLDEARIYRLDGTTRQSSYDEINCSIFVALDAAHFCDVDNIEDYVCAHNTRGRDVGSKLEPKQPHVTNLGQFPPALLRYSEFLSATGDDTYFKPYKGEKLNILIPGLSLSLQEDLNYVVIKPESSCCVTS